MPKRVGKHWEERVKSLKGEFPKWGAGRIARELQREAGILGGTGPFNPHCPDEQEILPLPTANIL